MFTTMNSYSKPEGVEVISVEQRHRRLSPYERLTLIKEIYQAVKAVSLVACKAGDTASQLFR